MTRLKVLLTGSCGRIGRHLVASFRERYELTTMDARKTEVDPQAHEVDLQDMEGLRQLMRGVDVVVHLAATSDEAPFVENLVPNNVVGVYNVYEAAVQEKVKRVIFASTVQTVGCYPPGHTVTETDPVRPVTMYGATKVFGEALGRYYHERRGLEIVCVRIGAFEPYDNPRLLDNRGLQDIWLSPADARSLLEKAIEHPDIGYALVFATSSTPNERLSLAPAREILGYVPQDSVSQLLAGNPAT